VHSEDRSPDAGGAGARRAATALCALGGLTLLGVAAFFGYEIALGESDSVARAVMSMLLILLGGIALLLLARGWSTSASWPRTPTIVWNALLLPVAWSLHQSGRSAVGVLLAVVAVGSIVAAVAAAPVADRPDTA
jgi:uncharacterized membrane protein